MKFMKFMQFYLLQVLIALDQLINAMCFLVGQMRPYPVEHIVHHEKQVPGDGRCAQHLSIVWLETKTIVMRHF